MGFRFAAVKKSRFSRPPDRERVRIQRAARLESEADLAQNDRHKVTSARRASDDSVSFVAGFLKTWYSQESATNDFTPGRDTTAADLPDLLSRTPFIQGHRTVSTIDKAERLKKELTDKWVVVAAGAPELKRFANLTGKVKTVNMNCRALVEFDGAVDIGWYDIDASYLTVVDAPKPKKAEAHSEAKPAAKTAPAVSAPAAGAGSPLDKIRAAGTKPAAASAAPAAGGSPLDKIRAAGAKPAAAAGGSPLDKIRAAAARPVATQTESSTPAPEETPVTAAPAATPKPAAAPMSGSPLDRIRAAGAAKKE